MSENPDESKLKQLLGLLDQTGKWHEDKKNAEYFPANLRFLGESFMEEIKLVFSGKTVVKCSEKLKLMTIHRHFGLSGFGSKDQSEGV